MINDMTLAKMQSLADAELADYVGSVNAARKRLETIEGLAKAELMRRGADRMRADGKLAVAGLDYNVTVSEVLQTRLDTEAVRKYLGPAVERFEKKTTSYTMLCKAIGNISAAVA